MKFLVCLLGLGAAHLVAQDLAIANARVISGNGTVINSGTLIIRGGKIVSVSAGAANTQGLKTVDAKGMSAMPGYIDAHRHVNTGPMRRRRCSSFSKPDTRPSCPAAAPRRET